jgi:GT2 family glycosyltransferase
MSPEIAVVVSTYRRPDRLRDLFAALREQTLDPGRWELVVVDNCSRDPEVDAVLAELSRSTPFATSALRTESNHGPAGARNLGWQSATAPVVAFVDDDVHPDPTWLEAGLRAFDDAQLGVVQGRTRPPEGVDLHTLPAWSLWQDIAELNPHFQGCNIFYRRDALAATGGFDEGFGWWGEDAAAGWQVVDAGWLRAFSEAASAEHPVEQRGVGWFLRNGWREHHEVALAARHAGFRREAFWRPWAYRRRDAAFALAVVSAVVGVRWRPALLGVLPYLWIGRPSVRHPRFARLCVETVAVDAVRSAAHARGAAQNRIFVL